MYLFSPISSFGIGKAPNCLGIYLNPDLHKTTLPEIINRYPNHPNIKKTKISFSLWVRLILGGQKCNNKIT